MLNDREHSLLAFLLDETEPEDPFAEKPSKQISLADLMASSYVRTAYRSVTPRTFRRELIRLADLGFILFTASAAGRPWSRFDSVYSAHVMSCDLSTTHAAGYAVASVVALVSHAADD